MLHINLTFAISFARFACGIPASCKFAYTVRAVHAKKKVIGLHKALNRRQFKEYYGFSALPIKFNYASATARQPIRLTLNLFLKYEAANWVFLPTGQPYIHFGKG